MHRCSISKYTHQKYFISDSSGWDQMYENKEFTQEDLVIQELIPHKSDLLIKSYVIKDTVVFWKINGSIPESFFTEK